MDEDKLKAIVKEVVDEAVNPIKQILDDSDTGLGAINRRLDGIEQRLDDSDTGLGAINRRLDGIEQRLDDSDTGLGAINRRLDANTGAVVELEKTVKGYADMYKMNDSNIRKMEKRLETVEEDAGIDVSPEFHLEPLSETPSP